MLRQVFAGKPQLLKKFTPMLSVYSFSRQEITSFLPQLVSAWAHYGELQEGKGNCREEEYYRSRALDFLDREKVVKPWYFSQLYKFYRRHNKHDQAFLVLRQAAEALPEYANFHIYLGDHYSREGILYRAREEYKQALLIDPADRKTRGKLEQLQ